MKFFAIMLSIFLTPLFASAADAGKIVLLSFGSNTAQTVRPGTAQFQIAGGFSENGCNGSYAAITGSDTHLVSLLLSAQAQDKEVTVFLDSNSKYYDDRCLVSYLEVQ